MDERSNRLPVWARDRIHLLEQNLAYARARLAAGPDDSNTFADPYGDPPRPLGTDVQVQWRLYNGVYTVGCHVEAAEGDASLEVMTSRLLSVEPVSGNLVRIVNREH